MKQAINAGNSEMAQAIKLSKHIWDTKELELLTIIGLTKAPIRMPTVLEPSASVFAKDRWSSANQVVANLDETNMMKGCARAQKHWPTTNTAYLYGWLTMGDPFAESIELTTRIPAPKKLNHAPMLTLVRKPKLSMSQKEKKPAGIAIIR